MDSGQTPIWKGGGLSLPPVEPKPWHDGTVLYVSGPMTGHKDWNHPAFQEATQTLREKGYWVLNPARQPIGLIYAEYMRRGTKDVYRASGLAQLPGWEFSPGASREHFIATSLGLESRPVDDWESLLEEAPHHD